MASRYGFFVDTNATELRKGLSVRANAAPRPRVTLRMPPTPSDAEILGTTTK